MSEVNNNVPVLRFAEFVDSGGWEEAKLIECAKFENKKIEVDDLSEKTYISTENLLPNFGGITFARKLPDTRVTAFQKNDVLISNIRPYLKKVWRASFSGGASNDVIVIRAKQRLNPIFLLAILQNDKFITYVMSGAKGVKMPRGDIESIKKYLISSPNLPEQQKIADCLSSLDEQITSESEQLTALESHKKGLMQQLFPADNQNIPTCRFPEFKDSGEWEVSTIGELGKFYYGKSAPKWSLSADAPTLCVRYGELYTRFNGVVDKIHSRTNIDPTTLRFSKGGEILVPRVGEDPFDFYKCSYLPFANIAIGEMISVYETKEDSLFYTYYFRTLKQQFARVVEGQNVKNLYYRNLEPICISKPKIIEEQQKIADCLASLDDLITAQREKIDALKLHKKGLMQGLFPSVT